VYFPLYIFCSFTENLSTVKYCTRLKSTFGIREIIDFRGDAFLFKGLSQDCDKTCYSGRSTILILQVKRNGDQFENGD
jgi:hypothetical protein